MSKADASESEKSDKDDKPDKAMFVQRLMAFIIDTFLISMVVSLIVFPFVDSESITKLQDSMIEVSDKYMNFEISVDDYFDESMPLLYQVAKKSGVLTLSTLFLEILYFIVYQYRNNGQTIGKKMMKIKVVSTDGQVTMNQMLLRALIIDSILVDMVIFGFVIFASQSIYFYGTLVFESIQYIVIFVSVIMMIFGKNGKGLHDLISHTEVIKQN